MFFQIESLIIWPRNTSFSPQVLNFKLGKVNVITGASRTGKTAIIPIIDYCLGSGTCSIPIEIIRDTAAWYGVVIYTQNERLLLARKVPNRNMVSYEFYVQRGPMVSIPPVIEENQNLDGVKQILDTLASVPYINRDEKESAYNERLSFRDLTHLVFQSHDIVANQNILFYKTHKIEHREKLRNWFPFILGAESIDTIFARRELKDREQELTRKKKELEKAKKISSEWLQHLIGQLHVAKEYGLYAPDLPEQADLDTLVSISRHILENVPDYPKSTQETLENAIDEMHQLEIQENQIANAIAQTQKRIADIKSLTESITMFQQSNSKKIERLEIAKWLRENAMSGTKCPICGADSHPKAHNEIERICMAVAQCEKIAPQTANIPPALQRELQSLSNELISLIEERNALHNRFDLIRGRSKTAEAYLQKTKSMFLFLGQLTSVIDFIDKISSDDGLECRIIELEQKIEELKRIIANSNTKFLTTRALGEITQRTLARLQDLDVDENYKKIAPRFSLSEFGLEVQGTDGFWHLLGEIGSASNWLSFHIAFTCALQEYFCEKRSPVSSVPSFIVYDQPSQVYFPRLQQASQERNEDSLFADEDVGAVKKIFETLASSIASQHGAWQAIVLDHAGEDIYGDIPGVDTIAIWRNGQKLIPAHWYEHN